ncbi:MAG: hypothetical protein HY051_03610 [Candidatus Aenigmarchaeota archaeon]|nr:hypothetical protein [Candidatus Aenigmarchaeota archaeon]
MMYQHDGKYSDKTALFNPLSGHLEQLFGYIDLGLPDLQRPFVWSNSKVRAFLIPSTEDTLLVRIFYGETAV